MNRSNCPQCKKLLVVPIGDPKAEYLIAGEFPGYEEIRSGMPFTGKAGEILQAELGRAGISIGRFRITNLWLHAPNEKECGVKWHMDQLALEMKGRKAALLMGSELSKILFGKGITDLSGMEMKHDAFPDVRLFFAPNPVQLFHGPVGEFRLALDRFASRVKW